MRIWAHTCFCALEVAAAVHSHAKAFQRGKGSGGKQARVYHQQIAKEKSGTQELRK